MSELTAGNVNNSNIMNGTPLIKYSGNVVPFQNNQNQVVQNGYTAPIYEYPASSLYSKTPDSAYSGVNINIYNPAGSAVPQTCNNAPYSYVPVVQNQVYPNVNNNVQQQPNAQTPITQEQNNNTSAEQTPNEVKNFPLANTSINNNINSDYKTNTNDTQKTKQIVDLTDDYIKTLESYLRSADTNVRKNGINELIKIFEEDDSRYDNPALNALLNIALQDPEPENRMLAMAPIASGSAHGDENTSKLLQNLQTSDKIYGQEAKMANEALLKSSQSKITVPDNSPETKKEK